jgi:peptidyl-prolyl cis-trans isomerase C
MRQLPFLFLTVACGATPNPRLEGTPIVVAPTQGSAAVSTLGGSEAAQMAATAAGPEASVGTPPSLPASASAVPLPPRNTVATVAGQTVDAAELVAFWFQREPTGVRDMLEQLALSRLVVVEASRLGMVLDPEPVEASWRKAMAELEERVGREAPGKTLEDYIRGNLGREPAMFREQLRQEILLESLASRVVRAWVLSVQRAEARVIVTDSEESMAEVTAALAAGGDFEELAREHSLEESATEGGLLPPIVRSETVLSRLAFLTDLGEIGGPVAEQGRFLLIRVEGRPEPQLGLWDEVGPAVEASLVANPVKDPEYWQWKAAMGKRYEVDFRPLLDLVGEPMPMGNQ